ncbi:hypothetical protein EJV47_19735 [Hymenobacter gummosus]|uniref:Uncharacterized protein n=1 Tax=Hymenobacter gummosus TaxID=1776032 RepID=A0A431TYL3_9BACT|nr:hypothetical protein [Hymenobacter gummosus]RTQ47131.1 hypothetical protein EJV47_19735 [Hymenobacter gummosus]
MFIALGIGTLDAGLVASLIGLACLAAVVLLLLVRTIWPRSRSAARSTAARSSLSQFFQPATKWQRRLAVRSRAARPTDGGIDALGRFMVKAAAVAASVFLLTLIMGLVFSSTVTTVIGAAGLGLLLVLAILILSA